MFYEVHNKVNQRLVKRRLCLQALLGVAALYMLTPTQALAQPTDKTRIMLWLDDASSLIHLPVLLAQHLGYFKAEGLQVDVVEFNAAMPAITTVSPAVLQVWSAPLLMSLQAYRWQEPMLSIVQTGRTPQLALGVSKKAFNGSKNLKELEGRKVGVLESGSFAQNCIDYALQMGGGNPKNISYVALANPITAINQLHSGAIDYLCASDPLVTVLEKKGDIELLRNLRSLKETQRVFGGLMPGNSVLVPASLARKSPEICQALVNAVVRANKWLRTAGPSDLLGSMLDSAYLTDRAIYLNAVDNMRESYAIDGMLSNETVALAVRVSNTLEHEQSGERKKSGVIYTNEFVLQAKKRFKI